MEIARCEVCGATAMVRTTVTVRTPVSVWQEWHYLCTDHRDEVAGRVEVLTTVTYV